MVADDPLQKIKLKMFHFQITQDAELINNKMKDFTPIPVVSTVGQQQVINNFSQVKYDVRSLIEKEINRLVAEKERKAKAYTL